MAFLGGPRLLDWASSPPHLQFNRFVLTGYRPISSGSGCLRSLFYLHNELGNIYTHGEPLAAAPLARGLSHPTIHLSPFDAMLLVLPAPPPPTLALLQGLPRDCTGRRGTPGSASGASRLALPPGPTSLVRRSCTPFARPPWRISTSLGCCSSPSC